MTDADCWGCPEYDNTNPRKSGRCSLTDRLVRDMEDCPVEQPKEW